MMKVMLAALLLMGLGNAHSAAQNDADTYVQVEKAKAELPTCRNLLEQSKALGSISMQSLTYNELDQRAEQLTHCGFVFRITGDVPSGERAGDESDRYDAMASEHMRQYLKGKKLWDDFLKQDCRVVSKTCAKR